MPGDVHMSPPLDIWAGDAEKGRDICNGSFSIEGDHLEQGNDSWNSDLTGNAWTSYVHGFEWLRDIKALGGEAARIQARRKVSEWIEAYDRWDAVAWSPELVGRRLASWLTLYDFFGKSADDVFQHDLLESIVRQSKHLSRTLPGNQKGVSLLHAVRGLAFSGLSFAGREAWLEQALDILEEQIKIQILSDGGHVSRSPAELFEAFRIIIDIRAALLNGNYPVPEEIEHVIDRMVQALRFFRYPDKKLAVFNGAREGDKDLIDNALAKTNVRGKILKGLPSTGYERATAGRSLLMIDTSKASYPYDDIAHAAPLAFEFIYGKERIFVNCGSHPLEDSWKGVLRSTAAHNTVCIDYRNICEIHGDGHFGRRPRHVLVTREDQDGAVLIEGTHDGYVPVNGITHRRKLYLGSQGHDLRGEEVLNCHVGLGKPADICVRFHLHPSVTASLIQDGAAALLRLSGGAGWRFINKGGELSLEDSVYVGSGARVRKTKQLVIYGRMQSDSAKIKWALQRELK
jgi:uncharacterized heparinase superfamily protein